jgi:hypothetical protein
MSKKGAGTPGAFNDKKKITPTYTAMSIASDYCCQLKQVK